ncbi:AraC family transcriptional regulator [Nocardioides fonticola]|uniref:AraC family transcriptional regulator n=1 Tax=Nocardioides fonticola TaxID=450363 RepID=A0ABP7XG38_9ACTN
MSSVPPRLPAAPDPAVRAGFPRSVEGVALLVAFGVEEGIGLGDLLDGTGLLETWTSPDLRPGEVTAAQELRVIRNLHARRPHAGAAVGARYRAATFGAFGYALATSRTLFDLADLTLRYLDLSHVFTLPRTTARDDAVEVVVDGAHVPADVRTFVVARDATAIACVLRELVPDVRARLTVGPGEALLRFPAADLALPLRDAGALDRDTAESLCRDLASRRRRAGDAEREVRVVLAQLLPDGAPAAAVAAALGWSERTLRRRLAAEGVAYQALLDDVRADLAGALLAPPLALPVQEVARRLGYADATTFIRAHRRWTGRTPTGR